jgi:hypothetical protein
MDWKGVRRTERKGLVGQFDGFFSRYVCYSPNDEVERDVGLLDDCYHFFELSTHGTIFSADFFYWKVSFVVIHSH